MEEVGLILKKLGESNGLEMSLDENGACTLELSDGRVMLIQERADLDELDFVATLGPVPEEKRSAVFTDLLAANFYWSETFGATISWNADLEEAVIMYPLDLADATPESVETIFDRFLELQSAWADRLAGLVDGAPDGGEEDGEDDADWEDSDLIIKA
ncbi:MAG: type III secretion system chaperone [Kiritimatiellae bacterium]|nr:type III secretion system chaperone [Kiritimatiellia bacterium]MBQ3340524.1 type III secretion system chaperone [Kiritimatiellia bacterium]